MFWKGVFIRIKQILYKMQKIRIVDSHCHLNDAQFYDKGSDINEVLQGARASGVCIAQNICTSLKEFSIVYQTAQMYDGVFASIGVHPIHAQENDVVNPDEIVDYTEKYRKITCIGEVGLDYSHYPSQFEKNIQKENFVRHIVASQQTQLPLIVHTRNAEEDTADILHQEYSKRPFPIVMHCFTSSTELADRCLPIVEAFSASGIITFRNANDIVRVFEGIPTDKLLLETDAPYLAPVPHRGKLNYPAYASYVCMKLAQIKGKSYESMANITTTNYLRIFQRAKMVMT